MDVRRMGDQAERLLRDEAFQKAVELCEERITARWRAGETVGDRERAHAEVRALRGIVAELGILHQNAEIEKAAEGEE